MSSGSVFDARGVDGDAADGEDSFPFRDGVDGMGFSARIWPPVVAALSMSGEEWLYDSAVPSRV